ncbi:serine/threonine protein kinase [Labedella phragmitis]|uniref:non-specific serine/threonine protein kinase n=1 Tax=Labedella phragmitis TaxID=2498849 RepID=A0A3S4DEK6_9MICO|nr:serine/threonine-protein kinase [Labedella phragmitis]RWZ50025.1 serine/threonine protein kinase [Labedella phragmitis]
MRRAPTSPPDIPGLTFVRPLGSGGFSDVYLYEQELPRREVAVKVLAAETVDDQSRSAFVGEANLMAQLSAHPYIVTIYGAAVAADGRPYFVMEYCAGPSLAEQYKDHRFTVADALRTGVRLSSAVATAHAAGILHRDIKPANVLTNAYGWPALTDFGISAALDPDHAHAGLLPSAGSPTGEADGGTSPTIGMSIPWSPPEMFADHPQTDVRSDVFSLAATVYTLLAGHTPFEVRGKPNGMVDLIGRIERGTITPLEDERPDIPRSLLLVLARGMAVDKASRYDSVLEFARALQGVELELSFSPTTIDVPNLAIPSNTRPEGGDPDATRMRDIRTVEAQKPGVGPTGRIVSPPAGPTASQPDGAAGDDDRTIMRRPVVVRQDPGPTDAARVAAPAAGTAGWSTADHVPHTGAIGAGVDDATVRGARRSTVRARRRWIPAIVIGLVVVLVGGAVTAGILLGGEEEPVATSNPVENDPLDVEGVPAPGEGDIAIGDGGASVTFSWTNPDAREGDRYIWQRTDGVPGDKTPTGTPSATVGGIEPGDEVCVSVWIVRSGRQSPEPLEMCTS